MEISSPLFKLEIIGTDDVSILKVNHHELLGKGTRDYVLSVREELLTNRSMKIPEDWDLDWNINLGPIWTPDELGTSVAAWILPEFLHPLDTDTTRVAQADDRGSAGVEWENTNEAASLPTFSSELNGFKGMSFAASGSGDYLYSLDESGDGDLDFGTGDFAITLLAHFSGSIGTAEKTVFSTDSSQQFSLGVQEISGNASYKVYFGGSSTTATVYVHSDPIILTVGRSGGNQFLRFSNQISNDSSITGTKSTNLSDSQQYFVGAKEDSSNDRLGEDGFDGEIYEMIFYNGTLSDSDRERIEGYLFHKYNTGDLHSTHPYKTNPPRTGAPK